MVRNFWHVICLINFDNGFCGYRLCLYLFFYNFWVKVMNSYFQSLSLLLI